MCSIRQAIVGNKICKRGVISRWGNCIASQFQGIYPFVFISSSSYYRHHRHILISVLISPKTIFLELLSQKREKFLVDNMNHPGFLCQPTAVHVWYYYTSNFKTAYVNAFFVSFGSGTCLHWRRAFCVQRWQKKYTDVFKWNRHLWSHLKKKKISSLYPIFCPIQAHFETVEPMHFRVCAVSSRWIIQSPVKTLYTAIFLQDFLLS